VLTNSPVVRSSGARMLFLLAAAISVVTLLWMHHMRLTGQPPGLTGIFFFLFAWEDYGSTIVALLILLAAVVIPSRPAIRGIFRWAGEHPLVIAVTSFFVLCAGALTVYQNHPLCMD